MQYRHYAHKHGKDKDLSRVILLTPNERLSEQHIAEFRESDIAASNFASEGFNLFTLAHGLNRVDVLEITKLADKEGPNTIATRNLGDQNLLLVDEGHRGMSGKEEGAWFTRRSNLCAKGFTFEYSATFEQAVQASGNAVFENSYAKAVIFDYSYRWFYEDGFGKDYKIDNLPHPGKETIKRLIAKGNIKAASKLDNDRSIAEVMLPYFITACLLKFYQQLRIYEDNANDFEPFNLEKPLWVFVGSTVSSNKLTKSEKLIATDVALIIHFIADFLDNQQTSVRRMHEILTGKGQDTGLLDKDGNDIFAGAFTYIAKIMNGGESVEAIYRDILSRLFNNAAGGNLSLDRIKGGSGEVALRVGTSEIPFGLINVGDAKGLCNHVVQVATQNGTRITVEDSDFSEAMFASVKDSTSSVNLLIGSKKFVEGWDCWRVSTMGLMHVGRSEGSQIIQAIAPMVAKSATLKNNDHLREKHLALLNYDMLFFELERFKCERSWYNLNITKEGICKLLKNSTWYTLYIPQARLNPDRFDGVMLLQQVASVLLKSYCEHYYNYKKREYIEPRLELRKLKQDDDNLPSDGDQYQLIADGDKEQVIQHIKQIKKEIEKEIEKEIKEDRDYLRKLTDPGDIKACKWSIHLYQPLFHVRKGAAITILPVALNESEYQFVEDLKNWCDIKKDELACKNTELFLLRNKDRGKGVGFFEADNFHPDFILWMLSGGKQYVTFIEPHGLLHEGPASEKMLFYKRIKDIEKRLNEPAIILNSFILSWTRHPQLKWGTSRDEMEKQHVLFMTDDQDHYIEKLFGMLEKST